MEKLGKLTRYSSGEVQYIHKGKTVNSSVGNARIDQLTKYGDNIYEHDIGYVPPGYEHRPDKISDLFYGTPAYWWVILLINNIPDSFEGLNVGDRIIIPKI